MDTSEQYIKMCEKAEEIQALAPSREGFAYHEWFTTLDGDVLTEDDGYYYGEEQGEKVIWLPRQDQLQEMLKSIESPARVMWCVGHWCNHNQYAERFTSIEQLWLAFVMKEKYNKIWNGEDWG